MERKSRIALNSLRNLVKKNNFIIAILPTGYGKSQFFKYNVDLVKIIGRVLHALPLQAVVADVYSKLHDVFKRKTVSVGYQMGLRIEGLKIPAFTAQYVVTTIDSLSLNFYGIPIHELFRDKWHSDTIFTITRLSNVILDEFHLIVSIDVELQREEDFINEFTKQIAISEDIAVSILRNNRKVILLTATLSPKLIVEFCHDVIDRLPHIRPTILVYCHREHDYAKKLMNTLEDILRGNYTYITLDEKDIRKDSFWDEYKDYLKYVKTYIVETDFVDGIWTNIVPLLKYLVEKYNKVLFVLNSATRAIRMFDILMNSDLVKECKILLVHGKLTRGSRRDITECIREVLRKRDEKLIAIVTQVLEAGFDGDFDALITELAPAFSLIQRVGRVARHKLRNAEIIILVPKGTITIYQNELNISKDHIRPLVAKVYDVDITLKTIEYLITYSKSVRLENYRAYEVNINWKIPECKNADFMKLIVYIDDDLWRKIKEFMRKTKDSVRNMWESLNKFVRYTLPPRDILEELDENLKGSFVRTTALIPITYLSEIKSKNLDYLIDSVIPVDINFLSRYGEKILELTEDNGLKYCYAVAKADEYEVETIELRKPLDDLINKPLTTTIRAMRRALIDAKGKLRMIDEKMLVYGLGFKVKTNAIREYEINGRRIKYLTWFS